MTTSEVSEVTGIPQGTLQCWRHKGVGPAYMKLGKRVYYDPATLYAWMDSGVRETGAVA